MQANARLDAASRLAARCVAGHSVISHLVTDTVMRQPCRYLEHSALVLIHGRSTPILSQYPDRLESIARASHSRAAASDCIKYQTGVRKPELFYDAPHRQSGGLPRPRRRSRHERDPKTSTSQTTAARTTASAQNRARDSLAKSRGCSGEAPPLAGLRFVANALARRARAEGQMQSSMALPVVR